MQVLGCIGAGSFGKVFKVKINGEIYALKKINLQFDCEDNSEEIQALNNQVSLLTQCLYHPNVVRCYSSYRKRDHYFIVMEFVGHRSLDDLVLPLRVQKVIVNMIIQIALGLKHLKNKGIVHRDIKPSNILISEKGILKIADFGISKRIGLFNKTNTCLGTPFYTAPEIIEEKHYDFSVDVWSFGVVLYEAVHGALPFIANKMSDLKQKIRTHIPQISNELHHDIRIILRGCLSKKPENRLTIDQILKIPLIQSQMREELTQFPRCF